MTANSPHLLRVAARHRDRLLLLDPALPDVPPVAGVLAGRLLRAAAEDRPTVGDLVEFRAPEGGGAALVVAVAPRRSLLRRAAADGGPRGQSLAANVDLVLVAVPLDRPLNPRRLEREVALAWGSGARPLVVLTKADACADPAAAAAQARSAAPGVDVVAVSTLHPEGLDELRPWLLGGATVVLIGASGAGKSTLANALVGAERMQTGAVRDDGAGRHTTTHRELLPLPGGGWLIDTPGLRTLGMPGESGGEGATAVRHAFNDVATLASECRFADCAHGSEPGCAVRRAVVEGVVALERVEAWRALAAESRYQAERWDAALRAERRAAERVGARALRSRLRDKGRG